MPYWIVYRNAEGKRGIAGHYMSEFQAQSAVDKNEKFQDAEIVRLSTTSDAEAARMYKAEHGEEFSRMVHQ